MKLDTSVIITKGLCYVAIGTGTPMAASLAQWANSGEWPGKIQWVVIIIGGIIGGATQLLSFLSNSFSNYRAKVNGDGDPTPEAKEPPKP